MVSNIIQHRNLNILLKCARSFKLRSLTISFRVLNNANKNSVCVKTYKMISNYISVKWVAEIFTVVCLCSYRRGVYRKQWLCWRQSLLVWSLCESLSSRTPHLRRWVLLSSSISCPILLKAWKYSQLVKYTVSFNSAYLYKHEVVNSCP